MALLSPLICEACVNSLSDMIKSLLHKTAARVSTIGIVSGHIMCRFCHSGTNEDINHYSEIQACTKSCLLGGVEVAAILRKRKHLHTMKFRQYGGAEDAYQEEYGARLSNAFSHLNRKILDRKSRKMGKMYSLGLGFRVIGEAVQAGMVKVAGNLCLRAGFRV